MPDILVLIHTVSPLIQEFNRLCDQILPGIQVKHILDEPLAESIRQRGGLSPSDATRLWDHVKMAERIRGRVVLVTCSTLSVLVDKVRPLTALPIVKIDEAMIIEAVKVGPQLGVLATSPNALSAVRQALVEHGRQSGKEIDTESVLVPGALDALLRGDAPTHSRLVRDAIIHWGSEVNGLVLAQASMSSVLDVIDDTELPAPVFSSPHLALQQARELFGDLGWG